MEKETQKFLIPLKKNIINYKKDIKEKMQVYISFCDDENAKNIHFFIYEDFFGKKASLIYYYWVNFL
jgi:hypothetical protein